MIEQRKIETPEERDNRKKERELNDIRVIISTPEGRRFLWKIISEAGVFRTSFSLDENQMAYQEGRRSIGLNILYDLLDASPSTYMQMQNEYASEMKREENEEKKRQDNKDILTTGE